MTKEQYKLNESYVAATLKFKILPPETTAHSTKHGSTYRYFAITCRINEVQNILR